MTFKKTKYCVNYDELVPLTEGKSKDVKTVRSESDMTTGVRVSPQFILHNRCMY